MFLFEHQEFNCEMLFDPGACGSTMVVQLKMAILGDIPAGWSPANGGLVREYRNQNAIHSGLGIYDILDFLHVRNTVLVLTSF